MIMNYNSGQNSFVNIGGWTEKIEWMRFMKFRGVLIFSGYFVGRQTGMFHKVGNALFFYTENEKNLFQFAERRCFVEEYGTTL